MTSRRPPRQTLMLRLQVLFLVPSCCSVFAWTTSFLSSSRTAVRGPDSTIVSRHYLPQTARTSTGHISKKRKVFPLHDVAPEQQQQELAEAPDQELEEDQRPWQQQDSMSHEPSKQSNVLQFLSPLVNGGELQLLDGGDDDEEEFQRLVEDEKYMRMAIHLAQSSGDAAFPQPPVGAILVNTASSIEDGGEILGMAASDYQQDAVRACLEDAGLEITPLREWLVAWPASAALREALKTSTLYVTLEPSKERRGQALPPLTQLIQQSGIGRVVIGCTDPVHDRAGKGAAALHAAGLQVRLLGMASSVSSSSMSTNDGESDGGCSSLQDDCQELIREYSELANSKLQLQARKHFQLFGRPLGFLHCSVVDSDNLEAFARHGNAFGTKFGGKTLSFRNFGAYEIAPPPEVIWVDEERQTSVLEGEDGNIDFDADLISVDFEDEDYQGDIAANNPMMPWYEQADAVVATFPRPGNGPADDGSLAARLNGLKWLASHGQQLPAGVERILVMDATDLKDLPLTNSEFAKAIGGSASDVDVESFWRADDRKPTRVLLRRGAHAQARAAAEAAAVAAEAAAKAAAEAAEALESGDAARAAEAALDLERAARAETVFIQTQLQTLQSLRGKLEDLGVIVETINGGEPVDVMRHLGDRNGYYTVVWRAGCWGDRGVKSILAGAFQWVSAHLAVDAVGGKFWQLMLAENAVQAACGPLSKVKVFADQEDISLEYCDNPNVDTDCSFTIAGRPVRHIRLDCRIALVDENRPREFVIAKTKKIDRKIIEEEAPWFL